MVDWIKYRDKYNSENPIEFENWLLDKFRKFDNKKNLDLRVQVLLHIDLWKNGHRNLFRIMRNKPIAIENLPDDKEEAELKSTENLEALLEGKGIGIPTASAILTFLRPNVYTVIDKFTVEAINKIYGTNFRADTLKSKDYKEYLKYFWGLPIKFPELKTLKFRDIDKAIMYWGKELLQSKRPDGV